MDDHSKEYKDGYDAAENGELYKSGKSQEWKDGFCAYEVDAGLECDLAPVRF